MNGFGFQIHFQTNQLIRKEFLFLCPVLILLALIFPPLLLLNPIFFSVYLINLSSVPIETGRYKPGLFPHTLGARSPPF